MTIRAVFVFLALLTLTACSADAQFPEIDPAGAVTAPADFDHGAFTEVLRAIVAEDGRVDYQRLAADPSQLDAYLAQLAATDPENLSEDEQLAFYLNAYNAYILRLVAANYPIESVLKTVAGPFVPNVNSPFAQDFATIGGETVSLDEIEHAILRERFDEPRIHFALVCAALSCPPLRDEAYVGARVDAQLDDQARRFLMDEAKNTVPADGETARLSKIFDWFKGDFGGSDADVQRFIAPYFAGAARQRLADAAYDVDYRAYDWSLNDASN